MKNRALAGAVIAGLLGGMVIAAPALANGGGPQPIDAACADAPQGRFGDTSGVHAAGVDCIGWWGVTQGDGEGNYLPDAAVRRDQMATFIARTLELSGGTLPASPPEPFDDVTGTHAPAVNQLAELGVVGGVSATEYNPSGAVNRAQMASFLARAYEARTGDPLPMGEVSFADIEGNVHAENIVRIATAGLTGGTADGSYDPGGTVTRAQMGTFLARFLALLVDEGTADYPPANPVPLPPREPAERRVPVDQDPAILGSFDIEVAPGEVEYYATPLVALEGWTDAWFHDGEATELPGDCDPSGPYGGGRGVMTAMSFAMPDDPVASVNELDFWEADDQGCLRASGYLDESRPASPGSEVRLHVRNDGPDVFRGRAHLSQAGNFETVTHPAGTTATYVFDTIGRLDPAFDVGPFDAVAVSHPIAAWWYRIVLAETSDVRISARPSEWAEETYCDIWVDLYTPDGDMADLEFELVEQTDRCLYEITDVPAGRLQYIVPPEDALVVTVAPSS